MSACAVAGCKVPAKTGQLMCKPHWFVVSAAGRRDVNETWAKYRRTHGPHQKLAALGEYRTARDAAVKEITDKQDLTAQGDLF